MNKIQKNIFYSLACVACLMFLSFTILQQKPWNVPAEYKSKENPNEATKESLKIGKVEFENSCKSCHGVAGLGDGNKARKFKTKASNFAVALKNQTDGELFYKIKVGRDKMPSFDTKISDSDTWHIINYMRTLQKADK